MAVPRIHLGLCAILHGRGLDDKLDPAIDPDIAQQQF